MKVVVPMAGRGSRFADRGWVTPKPLIEVAGRPMVLWALESLRGLEVSEIIFIALQEHEAAFGVSSLLQDHLTQPLHIEYLSDVTEGQLCTVLTVADRLNQTEDVLVMASDSLVISKDLSKDIQHAKANGWAGLISTLDLPGDRWSFAKTNALGHVTEVAEKIRISDHASTGLYYFTQGADLVRDGTVMINRKDTTRGEYYVIPVYQKLIEQGKTVGITEAEAMWDMGTPEAKDVFESNINGILSML